MYQFALNVELPAGQAPEWVQLIPAGPKVVGVDGRSWIFDQAAAGLVMNNFAGRGLPLAIDWEHAGEYRARKGEEAPAAGWLDRVEVRDGSLWGRVEWTPRAANQISNREYRFLSPAFYFDPKTTRITALESAGLTNNPNLRLAALNQRQARNMEDEDMDLKALCVALELAETASLEQCVQAVTGLKAALDKAKNQSQPATLPKALCTALGINESATAEQAAAKVGELAKAAVVDMAKFAPRSDLDLALNRASEAEGKLKQIEAEANEAKIVAAVDKAQGEGKFAPASRDFYLAMCRKEGGLAEFERFATSAPKVIAHPELPAKPSGEGGAGRLSKEELAVCHAMGVTVEDYAKNLEVN